VASKAVQHLYPEEATFFEALRQLFNEAGSPTEVAFAVRVSEDAIPVLMEVYRGAVLPSWTFISRLIRHVEQKNRRWRRGRLRGQLGELQRLHRETIDALGLSPAHAARDQGEETVFFYVLADNTVTSFPTLAVGAIPGQQVPPKPQNLQLASSDRTVEEGQERDHATTVRVTAGRVWEDAPGYNLKPDPMTAQSLPELLMLLRRFWWWADEPGMRAVAERSGGAFSKSTVTKLIHGKTGGHPPIPPLSQKYIAGIIRGCGGDDSETARWVTAFRLLDATSQEAPRASVTAIWERMAQ
jgi:hypothetical protein